MFVGTRLITEMVVFPLVVLSVYTPSPAESLAFISGDGVVREASATFTPYVLLVVVHASADVLLAVEHASADVLLAVVLASAATSTATAST